MGARWVRGYRAVGSFKVKLVVYFLLLSLLPIAATFWGFTSVAGQSETRRVDARLQAGLRAVIASYQERLDGAEREAAGLARAPVFQKPIEARDLPALVHLLENSSNVRVTAVDGFAVGHPPAFSATREVAVFTRKGLIGTVTVAVPFDSTLVETLRTQSGLGPKDRLVILRGRKIVAASPSVRGLVAVPVGRTKTVDVGGTKFRTLVAPAVSDSSNVRFAV